MTVCQAEVSTGRKTKRLRPAEPIEGGAKVVGAES